MVSRQGTTSDMENSWPERLSGTVHFNPLLDTDLYELEFNRGTTKAFCRFDCQEPLFTDDSEGR